MSTNTQPAAGNSGAAAFEFLQSLARELSAGRVELPSFPDAAARVQLAVSNPDSTSERVAKVISADGGMASRVISMANSALLRRSGEPVTDLKLAIARLGFQQVRSASLAYAAEQLRQAPRLLHIRGELEQYWGASIEVAAMARAIATECRGLQADAAMLAGLLHNFGKVYILSRAPVNSPLYVDHALREQLMQTWHAGIGQAIAENWGLSGDIAQAIGGQHDTERRHSGPPDVQDVLVTAIALVELTKSGAGESDKAAALPAAKALRLDDTGIIRIVLDSQTELQVLNAALG